jgi:hypothetical protein
LAAARLPALAGDASSSAGSSTLTLATVNSNTGSFGSTTSVPVITVNGKGLITAASTATVAGVAKAWINFNATTSAIRGSFNVASITKIGTGRFTITFTTAMSNANYAVTAIGADINQSLAGDIGLFGSTAPSTTSVDVGGVVNGSTYYDFPYMMFSING